MKKEIRKNKLIQFFKISSESLFAVWANFTPPRFSNDESGLSHWKNEISESLSITDEEKMIQILKGELDPILLERLNDWGFFTSIIPDGDKIRRLWRKGGEKSYSSFISWLKSSGLKKSDEIKKNLEEKISAKSNKEDISSPTKDKETDHKNRDKKINYDLSSISDEDFYKEILRGINAPETENNILYLLAWRQSEGGNATFNPFNTTQRAEGATNYNKVGVKNYISAEQGIKSTVKTLLNGRYENIISCLKRSADPMETAEALENSPWGTGGLTKKVISGYQAGHSPRPKPIAKA